MWHICQEVCPFNERRATPTSDPAFKPRESTKSPLLGDLACMKEEEFREQFRGSPVKRAKWRGLLRNVAAALSSSDDPDVEVALKKALGHPEEVVREQAAMALNAMTRRRLQS